MSFKLLLYGNCFLYVKLPMIGLLMDINFFNKQTEINKLSLTLLSVNNHKSNIKYLRGINTNMFSFLRA